MIHFAFDAIGTSWRIDIDQDLSRDDSESLLEKIKERIESFEQNYSRFRKDSLVGKISRETGDFTMPSDAEKLFALYHDIYLKTGGLVTPFMGNLISDAGYDAEYSLTRKDELRTPPTWDDVISFSHPTLTVKQPVMLDFGAAGKGYIVDIVGKLIEDNGMQNYCVDAGGDMLYKGKTPIRVGLENPWNMQEMLGVYTLESGSICGSSGSRRAWGNFTHIINPHTKSSPTAIIATWVAAKDTFTADMLATCLFFIDPKQLTEYEFEYCILNSDHSIEKSENFSDEIFSFLISKA